MTPEWVAVVEVLDEMAPDTIVGRNSFDGSPVTAREAAVHLRAGDPWADEYMADVLVVAVTVVSGEVRDAVSDRAAIVAALRRWAEDGCDPWMSYCADRIEEGAHMNLEK